MLQDWFFHNCVLLDVSAYVTALLNQLRKPVVRLRRLTDSSGELSLLSQTCPLAEPSFTTFSSQLLQENPLELARESLIEMPDCHWFHHGRELWFPQWRPLAYPDGADIPSAALVCTFQLPCQKMPLLFVSPNLLQVLHSRECCATPQTKRSGEVSILIAGVVINNTPPTKPSPGDVDNGITHSPRETEWLFDSFPDKFLPHFLGARLHNPVWV